MRSLRTLRKVAGTLAALILVAWVIMFCVDLNDRNADRIALTSANLSTQHFNQVFSLGESEADIQQRLVSQALPILRRGTDTLIIAKEGHGVWYCSHNYFGTALVFDNGKLIKIKSDEWLDTCL